MVTSRSSTPRKLGTWAIDSRTYHNYCNDINEFKKDTITEANMMIKLEDENEVHTREKGTVQLNGVYIQVFFLSEFSISLPSIRQLDSYSLTAILKNRICTVIDYLDNLNTLSATLCRGLYILPQLRSAHTSSMTILSQVVSTHVLPTTNIRKTDSIEV
jgi:hypothetical protein